jgi:hypothetical protein
MPRAAALLALPLLVVARTASADCVTDRCPAAHQAAVEALRTEIDVACDCRGSADHRGYVHCAKAQVRTAVRDGRVSAACGRAVPSCERRSTCGREGAVVCCTEKRGRTVARLAAAASECTATVCAEEPHAVDACAPDARCCVAVVERGPPDVVPPGSPLGVASGFEVRANGPRGCAGLDGPLVALNWFSIADPERFARYEAAVVNVLRSQGHRAMLGSRRVETLLAPTGVPAGGGAYEHEVFALAWYASAGGFLDFLRSEAQQMGIPDQQAGARQSDYVWGLQRCIIGCADAPLPEHELFLAHLFRYDGRDLDRSVRRLAAARRAPEVFYAENVAELRILVGAASVNPQKVPWGRGAIVFRVASRDAAIAWVADRAYASFRRDTAEDVIVLLEAGTI